MKSSNLARRIEPADEIPVVKNTRQPVASAPPPHRPRPRLERRTIVIRDQGFAPFRVR
jgi:hypothetical protein